MTTVSPRPTLSVRVPTTSMTLPKIMLFMNLHRLPVQQVAVCLSYLQIVSELRCAFLTMNTHRGMSLWRLKTVAGPLPVARRARTPLLGDRPQTRTRCARVQNSAAPVRAGSLPPLPLLSRAGEWRGRAGITPAPPGQGCTPPAPPG
jgi:hypothetical protein